MHTDEHLMERLRRFEGWMREGRVPFSAKVVPINEAYNAKQWVLPTQKAIEIIRNARSFALADCTCRSHYRRCSNPLDTCLMINDVSDAFVEAGKARRLPLAEAEGVLRKADEHGLVHLSVYRPEQYVWAVCSCCTCCCYQLQLLLKLGRDDLVVKSDYVAVDDAPQCDHCGLCVGRCVFGARESVAGRMYYRRDRCYGCGLCVTACPQGAIALEMRTPAPDSGGHRGV